MTNENTEISKPLKHKLPYWDELPEIDLYMDQVIVLMEKYLSWYIEENQETKIITPSMINNYVKLGIIPPPEKKKYSKVHIAYLIIICSLKQVMPIPDIKIQQEFYLFYMLLLFQIQSSSSSLTLEFFQTYDKHYY